MALEEAPAARHQRVSVNPLLGAINLADLADLGMVSTFPPTIHGSMGMVYNKVDHIDDIPLFGPTHKIAAY